MSVVIFFISLFDSKMLFKSLKRFIEVELPTYTSSSLDLIIAAIFLEIILGSFIQLLFQLVIRLFPHSSLIVWLTLSTTSLANTPSEFPSRYTWSLGNINLFLNIDSSSLESRFFAISFNLSKYYKFS